MELSPKELEFLQYWENQRMHKKSFLKKLSIGLPLGALIAVATLVSLMSGWYQKAQMELYMSRSSIIVILFALCSIVIFIAIFSAHYRWDRNEQQYMQLLAKSKKADNIPK